ncbi:hypothetical protein KY308_00395 [Candidatus Woesearchaeota archaeon]|nr:hypothetical protein [Candidatus Woesearchaeota archaeon]
MKKIILIPIAVMFICSFLVGAGALKETSSSTPVITLTFSEDSRIKEAKLTGEDGTLYGCTYDPQIGDLAVMNTMTLTQALINGNYTLFVEAEDRVENNISTTQIIEVIVPYIPMNLYDPPLGVSPTPVFDWTIQTPQNPGATCKYSNIPVLVRPYDNALFTFSSASGLHTQYNFNNESLRLIASPQSEKTFYVYCKSEDGRINPTTFLLSYDLTPPKISAVANPKIVVDKIDGKIMAQVEVSTDGDKVVCRYSNVTALNDTTYVPAEGSFSAMAPHYFGNSADESNISAYKANPITKIDLESLAGITLDINKIYYFTVNISCINRATTRDRFLLNDYTNRTSNTYSLTIPVNLLSPLILTKISPADSLSSLATIFLNFTTNKVSFCTYSLGDTVDEPLDRSSDGKVHSATHSQLPEGIYTINVKCSAAGIPEYSKDFQLIIDATPPTRAEISSPNATCSKSLTAQFSANDTLSGIGGYNYTVSGTGVLVRGFVSGQNPSVTVSKDEGGENLNMTTAVTYIFRANAVDNAGNTGPEGIGRSIIYDETGVLCDTTPPSVFLRQNSTSLGTYVTLVCIDGQTRCDNTSYMYHIDQSSECIGIPSYLSYDYETEKYGTLITSSGYFCYEAKDLAGNLAKGSEQITIVSSEFCQNNVKDSDETDIDCGGNTTCPRCLLGEACMANSDCSSLYCDQATSTCSEPSCDDAILNGYESDIDCGGLFCAKCDVDQKCSGNSDCVTGYCTFDKVCAVPTCDDSVKNGNETDVDCGGNACSRCSLGKGCLVDSDCLSNDCFSYECVQQPIPGPEQPIPLEEEAFSIWSIIKLILIIIGLLSGFGGSGYLVYKKKYKKKPVQKPSAAAKVSEKSEEKPMIKPKVLSPAERMRIMARREKEKIEKGLEREKIFGVFGKGKPLEKGAGKIAPKTKIKVLPRVKITTVAKPLPKKPSAVQEKEPFERLGELSKKQEEVFERLEKLKKKRAFEKLEKIGKKNKSKNKK